MARRDAHAAMCVQRETRQAAPTEPIARRDHGPHGRHHCTARAGAVQCSASSADQRQRSVLDHHQLRCSVRIQAQVIPRPNNRGSQRPAERARGVQCMSRRLKRPVGTARRRVSRLQLEAHRTGGQAHGDSVPVAGWASGLGTYKTTRSKARYAAPTWMAC